MALLVKRSVRQMPKHDIVYSAASAGGDVFPNPGADAFLLVDNASGASIDVTVVTPGTLPNGAAYPDTVVAVPAGASALLPMPASEYARASDGSADISYSASASVFVSALSFV